MNKQAIALLITVLIVAGSSSLASSPDRNTTPTMSAFIDPQGTSTTESPTVAAAPKPILTAISIDDVVEWEMRNSFNFFWEQANTDIASPGYGLIRDRFPGNEGIASVASIGFGLTAYVIGVEKNYIPRQAGYDRANKTLDTLLAVDREHGFFYHFVDIQTGKRVWNSEVSNIDSSILLMGVLSAGQYFGGDVQAKAKQLYDEVDWPWFFDPARNMFYMAYYPERGFEGHWDFYAEQLMMYVLAAGSDSHPIDETAYYTSKRDYKSYGNGQKFIHSWFGSIFTYQFSHAWIDFRGYADKQGVNWFENSVEASLAHLNFATDVQSQYKTISPLAWGLTACDGPDGYNGLYGAPPSGLDNQAHTIDDTVAPSGSIGSMIFLPEHTKQAMLNYYSYEQLKGQYGFLDAYNLSKDWFATDVIGIDKGISLLMLANSQNDLVHQVIMKNGNVLKGLDRLQIKKNLSEKLPSTPQSQLS